MTRTKKMKKMKLEKKKRKAKKKRMVMRKRKEKVLKEPNQGSNLVVINPANIRIGLAPHDTPLSIPHCIARYTTQTPKINVQDQMLNSQVTTVLHMDREKAYDTIALLLKIPFLEEEVANDSFPRKIGRVDGFKQLSVRKDVAYRWTNKRQPMKTKLAYL